MSAKFRQTLKYRLHYINMLYKKWEPMDDMHNLLVECIITTMQEPKTVWELGTGEGHWAAVLGKACFADADITLVEDFSMWENYNFINTEEKLSAYIRQFELEDCKVLNCSIDQLPDSNNKIDLIRLDCDSDEHELVADWIHRNGSDRLVVFIDDTELNRRFDRFLLVQSVPDLEIVYLSDDFACFAKPGVIDRYYLMEIINSFSISERWFDVIGLNKFRIKNKRYDYINARVRKGYHEQEL